MNEKTLSFGIVVSNVNQSPTLRTTLDSILNQSAPRLELFVVDQDSSRELAREYQGRVAGWEQTTHETHIAAVNHAFAQTRATVMLWLSGADKLCPWALRLATFVFVNLREVKWLTSGTPLTWSPTGMCVPAGLADGYTARGFFAGRNLKTSPYFHFPIWRSGTMWRRDVWDASGAEIRYRLEDAGDFELWMRFWQHADLVTLNVPVGGAQVLTPPLESETYWTKARAHLNACQRIAPPFPLWLRAQKQLLRRIPALREKWTAPARLVWISPPTLECGISTRGIL